MSTKIYKNTKWFKNWSQNNQWKPEFYLKPNSIDEIREALKFCRNRKIKMRISGAMLSPSKITATSEFQLDMRGFNKVLQVDTKKYEIDVQSGVVLKDLIETIKNNFQMGLEILPSITDQTVGGLLSTVVHGTGRNFGSFCSLVERIRIMDSKGRIHNLFKNKNKTKHKQNLKNEGAKEKTENDDLFRASLAGLGSMGIILDVTLRTEKAANFISVQHPVPLSTLFEKLEKFSVENFYFRSWIVPHADKAVVWFAEKAEEKISIKSNNPGLLSIAYKKLANKLPNVFYQNALLAGHYFPSLVPLANKLYFYLFLNKRVVKKDIYDRIFTFDCLFNQRVSEWAVKAEQAADAIKELVALIRRNQFCAHFPIEVRFSGKESAWLSPAHDGDVCYVGIIMYMPYGVESNWVRYFDEFERLMVRFNGKPHWAKEFKVKSEYLRTNYKKFDKWMELRKEMDPENLFTNEWFDRVLRS